MLLSLCPRHARVLPWRERLCLRTVRCFSACARAPHGAPPPVLAHRHDPVSATCALHASPWRHRLTADSSVSIGDENLDTSVSLVLLLVLVLLLLLLFLPLLLLVHCYHYNYYYHFYYSYCHYYLCDYYCYYYN